MPKHVLQIPSNQGAENERLQNVHLQRYTTPPPLKIQGPLWVKGWEEGKGKRLWVDDYCVFWKQQRAAHMNSSNHTSIHKTRKPKLDHVSMKREVEHNVPPLTEELLSVLSCGERKGLFSIIARSPISWSQSICSPHTQKNLGSTNWPWWGTVTNLGCKKKGGVDVERVGVEWL